MHLEQLPRCPGDSPHILRIIAARNSGPPLFGGDHWWPGQLVEGLVSSHVPRPIWSTARIERLVRYLGRADDESDVRVDEGANVGRQLDYHSVTGLVPVGQGPCILCLCPHPAIMLRTSRQAQISARRRRRLRDRADALAERQTATCERELQQRHRGGVSLRHFLVDGQTPTRLERDLPEVPP